MRIIKIIPLLLCGLIMFTSCVKEELSFGSAVEGEPTLIKFSLSASYKNESPSPRVVITEADEKKFKDIRVLIFDSQGKVVTNKKVSYPEATATPNLTIETYSGNNRTLYVVANAATDLDTKLTAVQTKAKLLAMQTTVAESALGASGKPLLMTAVKEDFSIQPGTSAIPEALQMEFMAAKVTLVVKDKTPDGHSVTILGWDIIDGASNSYVIPNVTKKDANTGKENQDDAWTTTTASMAFDNEKVEDPLKPGKKTTTVTQYLFENRRGGRENNQLLPSDAYPDMSWLDKNDKGKAWFAPPRATAFVIHAMYKADGVSKAIEAKIFIGGNEFDNYDIERGKEYIFTVTVIGITEIDIDTNLEHLNTNFVVQTSAPLNEMDAHPDFRPFMISGDGGAASIEILDEQGHSYNNAVFDAKWVKVSPLNLMYHQVRQAAPNDAWQQQAGDVGSFVRAKYIPHKSVREQLEIMNIDGWNQIPADQEDDDVMTFANATHRMCYKITDIPFTTGAVTSKTLCVYTDDYNVKNGRRSAKVKVTFQKNGSNGIDEWEFTITQNGYLTIYDEANPNAGLAVFNQDGTPSTVKKKFGVEQFEEVTMRMNLEIPNEVQMTNYMHWGFNGVLLYNNGDKYRNGYFLTANEVYTDVMRTDNRPRGFGKGEISYRPMYGNGKSGDFGAIPNYTSATLAPYYYPDAAANIYHPIYKSSAARYCHEKNRDINGDGFIDDTETHWYLPSEHELRMLWISNTIPLVAYDYWSATERGMNKSAIMVFITGYVTDRDKIYKGRVRCVREI